MLEKVNRDIEMNGGVFLCTKEGYYQLSAGIGTSYGDLIGVYLTVNSRHKIYARYLQFLKSITYGP